MKELLANGLTFNEVAAFMLCAMGIYYVILFHMDDIKESFEKFKRKGE